MTSKESIVLKDKDREEKAETYHRAIVESVKGMNKSMRTMIVASREVRDKHLFVELGYDSFASYLAQPEIAVKPATMEKYIKLYEETVGKDKLSNAEFEKIPISKMELIAPLKNPHGWVESAITLSHTDLRKKILEKIHGVKPEDLDTYEKKTTTPEEAFVEECPNWNPKTCRCRAGVDITKPVIDQPAKPAKKEEVKFKSFPKDKDKGKNRDLI